MSRITKNDEIWYRIKVMLVVFVDFLNIFPVFLKDFLEFSITSSIVKTRKFRHLIEKSYASTYFNTM